MTDISKLTHTKMVTAYRHMVARCRKNHKAQRWYYDRDIYVCREWLESKQAFFDHIGLPPTILHQLDRIDNDDGYRPGNVRWATPKQNSRNKSDNTIVEVDGVKRTIADWADIRGMRPGTILWRLSRGWKPERAIGAPVRPQDGSRQRIAEKNGIPYGTFKARIQWGWTQQRAETQKVRRAIK